MHLWRIVPSARLDDTRWEDHPAYPEVVVRAETAAMARLTAGRALYHENMKTQFGEEHDPIFISAFDDEKLYRVSRIESDSRFQNNGPREVVSVTQPEIA
jgi:hypothetical protein